MQIDKRTRTELKQYFVKNAIPTESNFAELIDGMLSQRDDGIAKLPNDALSIEAAGDQKKAIHFYTSFGDTDPTWVLSLNPRLVPADATTAKPGFSIGDSAGTSRLFIERSTGRIGIGTLEPKKKLHIQGATTGPFFDDGHDRPGIVVTGHYPEIALFSNVDNGNHGPAIRLGSYTDATASTTKHWVIGTAGRNASFLDIGFSDKNDPNPHAGIRNFNGKTILTLSEDGSVEVTGKAILGYENTIRDYNAALRSGFYQNGGTAATGDIPDTSHAWTHLFVQRHSNAGNNHQLQIAGGYAENDRLFFRKIARLLPDATGPAWNELATRADNIFTGNQTVKGAIVPSFGNAANKGIQFPSDPGGGGGDAAFIRYYPVTGETCKLMIGINNDADDTIGLWTAGAERMTVSSVLVTVSAHLTVTGAVTAGNSDIYFTNTEHNHTGIGNTAGFAAIENSKFHDSLMILGRAGTDVGRKVRLWDYLKVEGTLANLSDATTKRDIASLEYGLAEVKRLRSIAFNWIDRPNPHKSLGLIGQEVREIVPEVVYEDDGQISISYLSLIPVLINAIKELDKKIVALLPAEEGA